MHRKEQMMAKKRRSKGSGIMLKLVILLLVAAGLWQLRQGTAPVTKNEEGHYYQVQKTGAGVTVDFTKAGRNLDEVILKTIKDRGLKSKSGDRQPRQVTREQMEGFIKWENRHITVAVPTEAEKVALTESLTAAVKKAGGQVFGSERDTVEGKEALRLDIGLADSLENDTVTVITHNIWLLLQTDTPVSPPKESANGTLPGFPRNLLKQSRDGKAPPMNQRGRLALVIDDCGLTMDGIAELLALDQPITFAVLPYHRYSAAIARQAVEQGKQVILHLPLESVGGVRAEPATITTAMTQEQIKSATREAVAAVPHIIGVNNHQGSKATADGRVITAVLTVLQEQNLFFLDSRTSAGSVAYRSAKNLGMRAVENDHFIDNSSDVEAIKRELRTAAKLALSQGEAVAIGHIRPHTVSAIRDMVPELESMGVQFVFVSGLAR